MSNIIYNLYENEKMRWVCKNQPDKIPPLKKSIDFDNGVEFFPFKYGKRRLVSHITYGGAPGLEVELIGKLYVPQETADEFDGILQFYDMEDCDQKEGLVTEPTVN